MQLILDLYANERSILANKNKISVEKSNNA